MFWTRPFDRLAQWLGLEPSEGRRLLLMGALVSVLLCAYTIAKVQRDALFLAQFGALALPYAYLAVALGSVAFVWIESRIARRVPRLGATRFNQYFAISFSVAVALLHPHYRYWTTAVFYVWTGSQAMMLLPHFWTLALEIWDSRRARRVFPLLAGCGLLGGLAGGGFAGWSNPLVRHVGLMWTLPLLLLVAHGLTRAVEAHRPRRVGPNDFRSRVSPWKIMRRSPYIRVLVAALALCVIVGTLVDFQFMTFLRERYRDPQDLTQFLGRFYAVLNALSLVLQFGVAGFLLQRLGLGFSMGLQPASVLALSSWLAISPGIWVTVALRWTQGVLSQTLGKSTNEIYYTAIRPSERRRIKPAIDTLVERWSDAAVGVLLILVLHVLRAPIVVIAIITAALSTLWIVVLFALDRQYGRAFHQVLSSHWMEPEEARNVLRIPSARRALLEALRTDDEPRIVLALQLSGQVKDPELGRAVLVCLSHDSPGVRAAAVAAMESMKLEDRDNRIAGFLDDAHEDLRRAAVSYLLVRAREPVAFARRLLDGNDPALQRHVVDALFERRSEARSALTLEWIDVRIASGERDNLLLAARALGAMSGPALVQRLRQLLAHPDVEVRRAALFAAVRCPAPELLDLLLPSLLVPELNHDARMAVAAVGDKALPGLERLLQGELGARAQSLAARTLAQIGSARAVHTLIRLAQSSDIRLRHLGLRGLARARVLAGPPLLPRETVHRLFLRELNDYRDCLGPAAALETHAAAEVRLLAESYRESAERALERAVQALACWYAPEPLAGVFDRLKSRKREITSPALDYLEHVLPRATFGPVRKIFEELPAPTGGADAERDPLPDWIESAWKSRDGWLRACAVRASRHAPTLDLAIFPATDENPHVQAELSALLAAGSQWFVRQDARVEAAC